MLFDRVERYESRRLRVNFYSCEMVELRTTKFDGRSDDWPSRWEILTRLCFSGGFGGYLPHSASYLSISRFRDGTDTSLRGAWM